MKYKKSGWFLIAIYCCLHGTAQSVSPALLHNAWSASWITVPGESQTGYGVYLFRKTLDLVSKPDSFIIHVSADNRYKLYVNEKPVSLGPARGDPDHWNYETLDIAPFLNIGNNCISAIVWNEGEWRAEGQISLRTGFILQADDSAAQALNTGDQWKCMKDNSYQPLKFETPTYYVAGPGELVDMNIQLSGWGKTNYDDKTWKNAQSIAAGIPKGLLGGYGTIPNWLLIQSVIPQMELKNQRLLHIIKANGIKIPDSFPSARIPVQIPAHQLVTILIDQGFLTNAYPELLFSGGRGAGVSLSYAEALYIKYPAKGNRNETEGKIFIGRKDSVVSNGSARQVFIPLSFRTYRYVQIRVTTGEDPMTIDDFYGTATGYPFDMNARLESDNPELSKMLEIGWRTARNCAMETYMDCPYYEQLQYIGDARIQALISLYNSGDERLLQNALNDMDNSRRPEGVTLSRHPSYTPQYIPTFSFWYIGMLHDYMMYGRDSSILKNKLAGERQILQYFRNYQLPDGSLKGVPYWMFTDWVERKDWVSGAGPVGKDGCSALIDLQLLWAYQLAADLESKMGMPAYASLYNQYAGQLKQTIRKKYFDEGRKLFADRAEKDLFSQHANALAILTGIIHDKEANATAHLILTDTSLAPASIYFKYYLHQALVEAGLGNDYLNWLTQWRENIKMGLTTWAEIPDINNARSDCHAWGASPNIEFFRTLLGIDSDAPGFTVVKIEPHLGSLKYLKGEIPHPRGKISASYQLENGKWKIHIELPPATTGNFIWREKAYPLTEGKNEFNFPY
jgi:alpha-L-rhamnosidase